jgi:hypothetical protein
MLCILSLSDSLLLAAPWTAVFVEKENYISNKCKQQIISVTNVNRNVNNINKQSYDSNLAAFRCR